MLENISTLLALGAEFLKMRSERVESATGAEFQTWLQQEMFPALLEQSELVFASVVRMKADNTEKFQTIIGLLEQIRETVAPDADDRFLTQQCLDVLKALSNACVSELGEYVDMDELSSKAELSQWGCDEQCHLLSNLGLVERTETTKSIDCRVTPRGYLKLKLIQNRTNAESMTDQVLAALPPKGQTERSGKIAEKSSTDIVFVEALLSMWSDLDLLRLEDTYPFSMTVVHGVEPILLKNERYHLLKYLVG